MEFQNGNTAERVSSQFRVHLVGLRIDVLVRARTEWE
jgi:hypothetical protein